jgi:hypothetical protein
MTFPQEGQLREHMQNVKREHDIRFLEVRNICTLMGTYMKIGWKPLKVPNISSIYNIICNNNINNNKHKKVYMQLDYRWREWKHILLL